MKKILFTILVVLMAQNVFAADCTQTVTNYGNYKATLTFVCTADSGGAFTATTTTTANTNLIAGSWLDYVELVPSLTTAPSSGWSATFKNTNSADILRSNATGLSASTPTVLMADVLYSPWLAGAYTFLPAGNSVANAVVTFIIHISK